MTRLLASVASAAEAEIALAAGADIIDLKDPQRGALGALPAPIIAAAVKTVAGRRIVSATAGDLPMASRIVTAAVDRIAAAGVDIVKVGLFPGGDRDACLAALAERAGQGLRIVAVLFADAAPDLDVVARLAGHGFAGVMLDTMDKQAGGLRRHLDEPALARFVDRAAEHGLLSGLAGSLGLADIPPLIRIGPDYLGFRGALCASGRGSALEAGRIRTVRAAIDAQAALSRPRRPAPRPPLPARSAPPTP